MMRSSSRAEFLAHPAPRPDMTATDDGNPEPFGLGSHQGPVVGTSAPTSRGFLSPTVIERDRHESEQGACEGAEGADPARQAGVEQDGPGSRLPAIFLDRPPKNCSGTLGFRLASRSSPPAWELQSEVTCR